MKSNRFLTERNKAFVKKITNLRESVGFLQNAIDNLMKITFTAHENLVINALTSSVIVYLSGNENMMYDDINDEDITDEKSDD